jgi:FAD/FMN-containing dehydrogenase
MDARLTRRTFLGAIGTSALAGVAAAAARPSAAQWARLRSSMRGRVVRPGNPGYGAARAVYDLRFSGEFPAAIALCESTTDVQRAVDFARRHGLAPIPRAGGHSYGGYSTGSGLVIDVSRMTGVKVTGHVATVGAGTRLVDLYSAIAAKGVLVPGGSCPTVGIAGLALGGGNGVLARRYGLTCDAIRSLTVVTADGSVLHPDASNHGDLHWASQGGGGRNFGIVTSLDFRAEPIPPSLALFTLDFPWAAAGDLIGAWTSWIRGVPDALWSNLLLLSAGSSGLSARTTGVYVGSTTGLRGHTDALARAVGAAPTLNFVGAEDYLGTMLVEAGCAEITLAKCHLAGPGRAGTLPRTAFAAKSAYLTSPPPSHGIAAFTGAVEAFQHEFPALGGALAFDSFGGAINRVHPAATAFVHRDALCQIQISASFGATSPPSQVAAVQSWLGRTGRAIAPYANGQAYQNYIDPTLADWPRAYYGSNLERLEHVKLRYDPDDVFSFHQSIAVAKRGH